MKAAALLSPMLRASVTCHSASVSREDIPVERRYGLERQETRPPQSGSAQGLARGSPAALRGQTQRGRSPRGTEDDRRAQSPAAVSTSGQPDHRVLGSRQRYGLSPQVEPGYGNSMVRLPRG